MRPAPIPLYLARIVDYDPRDLLRFGAVIRATTSVPFVGSPQQCEQLLVSLNCLDGAPWAEPRYPSPVLRERLGGDGIEVEMAARVSNVLASAQLRDLTPDEWAEVREQLRADCDEVEALDPEFAEHEREIIAALDEQTVGEFADDLDTMIDEIADLPAWRLYLLRIDAAFSPGLDEQLVAWRASEWWPIWD